jgi:ABC-2 type transport system permease protein
MRNVLAVARRELRASFSSPIACVVLTVFVFLSGLFFQGYLGDVFSYALQARQFGGGQPIDMPGLVVRASLGTLSGILLFIVPITTMGLISEEKKRGTLELLLTLPLTDFQLVLGKFLSAVAFYLLMLISTAVPMSVLFLYGDPALGPIATAYLGLFLYGVALLAIGLFVSSLTESQIIAGIMSFGVSVVLLMVDRLAQDAVSTSREVLEYLSIVGHLDGFLGGVLTISDVVFYLSLTTLGLFLTYRSIDAMRWKG